MITRVIKGMNKEVQNHTVGSEGRRIMILPIVSTHPARIRITARTKIKPSMYLPYK